MKKSADLEKLFPTYLLYGRHFNRVPVGQESNVKLFRECTVCDALKGTLHRLGCSNEQCPACGQFVISCLCVNWDECDFCEAKKCVCDYDERLQDDGKSGEAPTKK